MVPVCGPYCIEFQVLKKGRVLLLILSTSPDMTLMLEYTDIKLRPQVRPLKGIKMAL